MCAISGIILGQASVAEKAQVAKKHVADMVAAQDRRGPDGNGLWDDGRAFLGHNRLAIVDLSDAGKQPMESENWVLTFNGEIFNYPTLKRELEDKGYAFKSSCDTEALLYAIEEFGVEQAVERLNGFFAFGAYHKKTGETYLVRDRLGIKPLFYHKDELGLAFASLPAALATTLKSSWQLDYAAVQGFFLLGATYSDHTFFTGIHRLDAATFLRFDPSTGALSSKRYWHPQPRDGSLLELTQDAISIRRMGDVKMAVFFSGGVDSSFVASVLREVDAIHLNSPEKEYAEEVAKSLGIHLASVSCSDWNQDEILADYARHTGEASMAGPIPYMVAATLRERGYKVAFSANGADELFYGYPRTPIPGLPSGTFRFQHHDQPPFLCLRQQALNIFRNPAHFCVFRSENLTLENFEQELRERYHLKGFPKTASYRWLELQTYVLHDLNPTLDFSSMAHGLEVRTPFLDYRLVERALSADPAHLVEPQFGRKSPLKHFLLSNGVPLHCIQRPKLGFSLDPSYSKNLKESQIQSAVSLKQRGILGLHPAMLTDLRSKSYLLSSAHAFEAWCLEWMDRQGIVKP